MQYPQATKHIERTLVKLILEKRIGSSITGEQLNGMLRRLGLKVRLQTKIRVLEHGKIKSLEQKIKEDTS